MSEKEPQTRMEPISEGSPSGENLEYDPRFVELQRLSEGTREQQYGETIIAAIPPDWRSMRPLTEDLSAETRDLRLAVMYTEAMTHSRGLSGLADGLEMLKAWVTEFWEDVHPQLEEQDRDDPFVRINALSRVCEANRLPSLITAIPIIEAPPHLKILLGDLCPTVGSPAKTSHSTIEIEAAFSAMPLEELRECYEDIQRCRAAIDATVKFIESKTRTGIWDTSAIAKPILACTKALKDRMASRFSAADTVVSDVDLADGGSPDAWNEGANAALSNIRVNSRDDAAQVIEAATRYFERFEPSSPVPLLLRRAKRMINQDFVDILRDLAPDALVNAQILAGDSSQG